MSFKELEERLVGKTELGLRRRKWRRLKKEAERFRFSIVLNWLASIVLIIAAVILVNMFVFQNYRIPTPSMVPTLQVGDLILVEKMTFGPEILPGKLKLPATRLPRRGEVVSFESGLYAEQGPLAELADRFVFFITLSGVNLKTDESGEPIVDLLIKRVIGLPGDRVRQFRDRFEVLPACERDWIEEKELMAETGVSYTRVSSFYDKPAPFYRRPLAAFLDKLTVREPAAPRATPVDIGRSAYEQKPEDTSARTSWLKDKLGWYVPDGKFFPMGDNRPGSHDARSYGPVTIGKIQGKAVIRFFPFARFGQIE